jgi:signal transduction histidine kinase
MDPGTCSFAIGRDATTRRTTGTVDDVPAERDALEQRLDDRTRELTTLLDVSRLVVGTLELAPLLELIFDQLQQVVAYDSGSILLVEGTELRVLANRRPAHRPPLPAAQTQRFPFDPRLREWVAMQRGDPIIIGDVRGPGADAADYRAAVGDRLDTHFAHVASWLGVPLAVKGRLIGMLAISSPERDYYSAHDGQLAMALANHAAVAIENARLYEQGRVLAALEERQRLARELHDSVAQALFGIGLGAQTALTLLESDPKKVADPLRYILELANIGMAEMRALIFELRPESLEQEGLVRAIERQAAALGARYRVAIEAELGHEPDAPLPIKEALYRIAQEAMHNAVKHASPRTIQLRLTGRGDALELVITDDGVGFDPAASFPGHLGLRSMPERAQRLGGELAISSAPGAGTRVRASIPLVPQR